MPSAIQRHIQASNGRDGVWLAGAWLGYGFHEDGLASALRVARQLNAVAPWKGARRCGLNPRPPRRSASAA